LIDGSEGQSSVSSNKYVKCGLPESAASYTISITMTA